MCTVVQGRGVSEGKYLTFGVEAKPQLDFVATDFNPLIKMMGISGVGISGVRIPGCIYPGLKPRVLQYVHEPTALGGC